MMNVGVTLAPFPFLLPCRLEDVPLDLPDGAPGFLLAVDSPGITHFTWLLSACSVTYPAPLNEYHATTTLSASPILQYKAIKAHLPELFIIPDLLPMFVPLCFAIYKLQDWTVIQPPFTQTLKAPWRGGGQGCPSSPGAGKAGHSRL